MTLHLYTRKAVGGPFVISWFVTDDGEDGSGGFYLCSLN